MPDYKGTIVSRDESPALEANAAAAIEAAIRDLIEHRFLYQKIGLDYAATDAAITAAIETAKKQAATAIYGRGSGSRKIYDVTQGRLRELHDEIEARPWHLMTRHLSDDATEASFIRVANVGTQPLGTPLKEMEIKFYLPAIQLMCAGRCKRGATFAALGASSMLAYGSPYPRSVNGRTEQVFVAVYRCELCRDAVYTILVRRIGGRLHLSGFAPRREPLPIGDLPALLIPIVRDADQSIAEGDVFAAMYHLRTMIEHYVKGRLKIAAVDQLRGDDLMRRHYDSLNPGISSALPPLTSIYEKLSRDLHGRTGVAEDYVIRREQTISHVRSLEVLGDAANRQSGSSDSVGQASGVLS